MSPGTCCEEVLRDHDCHTLSTPRSRRASVCTTVSEPTTEDLQGLVTEDVTFSCGCQSHREEFHDGSVHRQVVNHRGRVLVDEEFRGE